MTSPREITSRAVNCMKTTPGMGRTSTVSTWDQVAGAGDRVLPGFAHGVGTGTQGAARLRNSAARRFDEPALPLPRAQNAAQHGGGDGNLFFAQQDREFVLAPARKAQPQSQNLF
jgi:hypothetical protein